MEDATHFTGATQARNDFGVTGDLNGNPNLYNTSDIVVAVVDTGIDANHVDLDGGKVIAFFDAVNNNTTNSYDDNGHGTHVAGIIAGTGDGNSNNRGFAPGAALVSVKVCGATAAAGCQTNDIIQGLNWLLANRNTFDIVNISIETFGTQAQSQNVIDLINQLNNTGKTVFVAAGNNGQAGYNTLSTYAKHTPYSVGNVRDPDEGGWGLSVSSSRGTGSTGPWVVAPGHNILAPLANSNNGYTEKTGTSMATPAVAGIHALMLDAFYTTGVNNGGSLILGTRNLGVPGFDKNYGNGEVLAYESIQASLGQQVTNFNDNRLYSVVQGAATAGQWDLYTFTLPSGQPSLNLNLLITDEGQQDLDLFLWIPGTTLNDAPQTSSVLPGSIPQDFINWSNPAGGEYIVGVRSIMQAANYSLEISY
ncbi:S8 family serine peptidase [Paenibacillus periandrae]|uniref:S8 family serine peptidase n=1 Tax=Paenibacillus periandrae TaxID=1761741 RepID=UPI001F09A9C8|nr:S8 family serine peptidase [Paenibacillus periandrae]